MSRTKIKKLWSSNGNPMDGELRYLTAVVTDGNHMSFGDFPATGRVIFHVEGSKLVRVESFDDGPSRRDKKNSSPKE
jgi:hypothetical protein